MVTATKSGEDREPAFPDCLDLVAGTIFFFSEMVADVPLTGLSSPSAMESPAHHARWIAAFTALVVGCEPAAAPPAAPKVETRKTIGKTTQNVLELTKALAEGGVLAEMDVKSEGLEVYADAYRTSVGRLSMIAVEQKMRLHEAEHDSTPETDEEFMAKIIEPGRPGGLQLPMLPYYQEYAYDPAKKQLVVVEFPEKKRQREKETTGASGL